MHMAMVLVPVGEALLQKRMRLRGGYLDGWAFVTNPTTGLKECADILSSTPFVGSPWISAVVQPTV